jgi:hypothetical protein
LALRGDEGRGKLRKALGRSKHPLIQGLPNRKTDYSKAVVTVTEYIGSSGEPGELKHLSTQRKRKQK